MHVKEAFSCVVGRLGELHFSPGYYVYIGSAHGPGGLSARCGRHLKHDKKLRWHIDYLTSKVIPMEIWYVMNDKSRESCWVKALSGDGEFSTPFNGFGSSDSFASSHLFYSAGQPRFDRLKKRHLKFTGICRFVA